MYAIIKKQAFYGPRYARSLVQNHNWRPVIFANRDAAKAWVGELEEGIYRLANGETGHPDYSIRRAETLARDFRELISRSGEMAA